MLSQIVGWGGSSFGDFLCDKDIIDAGGAEITILNIQD